MPRVGEPGQPTGHGEMGGELARLLLERDPEARAVIVRRAKLDLDLVGRHHDCPRLDSDRPERPALTHEPQELALDESPDRVLDVVQRLAVLQLGLLAAVAQRPRSLLRSLANSFGNVPEWNPGRSIRTSVSPWSPMTTGPSAFGRFAW